jgi:rhodanese-related sulfurtransferase
MLVPSFFISPAELWALIGTAEAPRIVDVRRRETYEASAGLLPTAVWREAKDCATWATSLDCSRPIVVACGAGHERSQMAAAHLREQGFTASVLAGGVGAWIEAGLPIVNRVAFERFAPHRPSTWVTRRRPKIDRVACPWLIRRFLDAEARFLFVDPPDVAAAARDSGAIPFDIEGIELSHDGERCSFDTMLKLFGLESEPSLARLAIIVRGADTARTDLAPEAAGLLAISLGLSAQAQEDDHGMLRQGFIVYDALYAWLRFAAAERHNWPAKAGKGTAL